MADDPDVTFLYLLPQGKKPRSNPPGSPIAALTAELERILAADKKREAALVLAKKAPDPVEGADGPDGGEAKPDEPAPLYCAVYAIAAYGGLEIVLLLHKIAKRRAVFLYTDPEQMENKLKPTNNAASTAKRQLLDAALRKLNKRRNGCACTWQNAGSYNTRSQANFSSMHAKLVVCENPPMIWNATSNWTLSASKDSFEHAVLLKGDAARQVLPAAVEAMEALFEREDCVDIE